MSRLDSLKWFVYYPVLALILIGGAVGIYFYNAESYSPVKLFESPLRAGDRVFLMTGQWKTTTGDEALVRTTDLFVDLWCFDARTATPAWRKRLQTERNGVMDGRRLLGAEGNVIWMVTPAGPVAASMADGTIKANPQTIEARNPELKGLLPKEPRYYAFDAQGLLITAADARTWRIDPQTFAARRSEPASGQPAKGVVYGTYWTPNSTVSFLERSLDMPGHWLGLLTERELETFRTTNSIGGIELQSRRRLYGAKATEGTNFFGKTLKYSDFKPLGKDFLGPGLLSDHRSTGRNSVIYLRNPESVLVLHRDRLGEEGKLRLARVAGPEGRIVWETALPISVLQAVLPGESSVVLLGAEFTPPKDNQPRDPLHSAHDVIVGIDLATGGMHVFDQTDVTNHIKATPENQP